MPKGKVESALVKSVPNVHKDDIHGISVIDKKRFVSGSKDGQVKLFNYVDFWDKDEWRGKLISSHYSHGKEGGSYNAWVTALDVFSDASVLVGHRDSHVLCKNVFNDKVHVGIDMKGVEIKGQNKECYKPRNMHRITGAKCVEFDGHFTGLIGMPQQFHHYDFDTKRILGSFSFPNPDWIYGFCQIAPSKIAVIHSCSLSFLSFKMSVESDESCWNLMECAVKERKRIEGARPFISSVFPMGGETNHPSNLALSFFGGDTMVMDIETKQALHEAREHQFRVWQAVPRSPHEYISCSDDATIKIWDLRAGSKSVHTYGNHPGRVSSVAVLDDSNLVAGTCPDNPHDDPYKGQFYFYDIRRSSSQKSQSSSVSYSSSSSSSSSVSEAELPIEDKLSQLSLKK
jgi:WD40 repeat protein